MNTTLDLFVKFENGDFTGVSTKALKHSLRQIDACLSATETFPPTIRQMLDNIFAELDKRGAL